VSAPFPADVFIDQNADFDLAVTWKDSTGSPVNLTGYTAQFSLAPGTNRPPLVTVSSPTNITLGGAAGTILVHIPYATTNTLGEGSFWAELRLQSGGGVATSLLKGPLTNKGKVVQ
jgi:hypothetical protein